MISVATGGRSDGLQEEDDLNIFCWSCHGVVGFSAPVRKCTVCVVIFVSGEKEIVYCMIVKS